MKRRAVLLTLTFALSMGVAFAADDPSIQGSLRENIQTAMREFVADNTVGGVYRHYDPVAGRLLELELEELHAGIVRKGDFFVSCADFVDPAVGTVDLDFLVLEGPDGLFVSQAIVHKSDGTKRPYHLEGE